MVQKVLYHTVNIVYCTTLYNIVYHIYCNIALWYGILQCLSLLYYTVLYRNYIFLDFLQEMCFFLEVKSIIN